MSSKIKLVCGTCGKEIYKYPSQIKQFNFCNFTCKITSGNLYPFSEERRKEYSLRFSGENNPNYKNKWTDEQKNAQSVRVKEKLDDVDIRKKIGTARKGKKFVFTEEHKKNIGKALLDSGYSHSEDTKNIIGLKSSQKFTPEFRDTFRKTMEDRGYWVPLENKSSYDIYYKESNWIDNMFCYFSVDEKRGVDVHGLFNRKNTLGLVRDHIVPRKTGFEFSVPVEIIRHPANMRLISHSENISKGFIDNALPSIDKIKTIIELVERIENYKMDWKEQVICLEIINNYEYP